MRKIFVLVGAAVVASVGLAAQVGGAAVAGSALVTNANNEGPGSFRAAIELANENASVGHIAFVGNLDPIELEESVVYTGNQSLGIAGNGAILDGNDLLGATDDAFRAEAAGNLSMTWLTFRNASGEGLAYELPSDASGTKTVSLNGVAILGNDGHGVLINDQDDPEDTAHPAGSAASLDVSVINAEFDGNGFGDLDRDGLRVNEGGGGELNIVIRNTHATDNGADGIELDERGDGDVVFTVSGTHITGNGSFDETEEDLDDGMDVDESNDGALIGRVSTSAANDNFEEGWDFNENNLGDFEVEMTNVEANGNLEEGVDFEEDDNFADFPALEWGGDMTTTLIGVTADENDGGDADLKIRERADGNISASVRGAQANDNESGGISVREQETGDLESSIEQATANGNGADGIFVREDNDGSLAANIDQSTADDNGGDGVDFDENSDGNLTATVGRGGSSNNGMAGVRADEGGNGTGALALVKVTLAGNAGGAFISNVPVTQTP